MKDPRGGPRRRRRFFRAALLGALVLELILQLAQPRELDRVRERSFPAEPQDVDYVTMQSVNFDPATGLAMIVADPELFWRMSPGREGDFFLTDDVRINALGMRDGPLAPDKDPHEVRLLFLGDSATFGMSVAESERYPEQLAHELRRRAPAQAWTTVDAGVVGYSVSQGLVQLPELLDRVQPDLVCLSFGINDCMLNPVSDADLREVTTSTYERLRHALRSSQVVAAAEGGWALALSEAEGLVTGQRRSLTRWLHYPRPSVTEARVVRVSVEEYLDCVGRAERMCRERGVALLLVTEYTSPEVRSRHAPDPAHHERIDRLYVALAAWAQEHGVLLADARGALRESGVPPTELLLDSYHPSAAGYARIAAELADTLEAAGWLERWRAR